MKESRSRHTRRAIQFCSRRRKTVEDKIGGRAHSPPRSYEHGYNAFFTTRARGGCTENYAGNLHRLTTAATGFLKSYGDASSSCDPTARMDVPGGAGGWIGPGTGGGLRWFAGDQGETEDEQKSAASHEVPKSTPISDCKGI